MSLKRNKKIKKYNKIVPVSIVCAGLLVFTAFINKVQSVAVKGDVEQGKVEEKEEEKEKEEVVPVIGAKKEYADKFGYDSREIMRRIETYNYANDGKKMVFLTFDDGPSTTNTPKVLDILNKHGDRKSVV